MDKTTEQRLESALRETTSLNQSLKEKEEAFATIGRALQRLEVQQVEDREWELEKRRMARREFKESSDFRVEESMRAVTRVALYEREVRAQEQIATALSSLAKIHLP